VMYPYQVEGRAEQVLEGGVGVEVALGASVVAVGDVVGVGVLGACALGDSFSCGGDAFSAGELLEGAVGFAPRLRLQPPRLCAGLRGFAPTGTPSRPRARLASRVQLARARLGTGLLAYVSPLTGEYTLRARVHRQGCVGHRFYDDSICHSRQFFEYPNSVLELSKRLVLRLLALFIP
jgi:hypothetical protein